MLMERAKPVSRGTTLGQGNTLSHDLFLFALKPDSLHDPPIMSRRNPSASPLPPVKKRGFGIGKFFLLLTLLALGGFGYLMVRFDESPQQAWERISGFTIGVTRPTPLPTSPPAITLAPKSTPTPEPSSKETPTPTPENTPSQTHQPTPEPTPDAIAWFMEHRDVLPKTLKLIAAREFPIIADGKVSGKISAPTGSEVALVNLERESVTILFGGSAQKVPVDATDLPQSFERSKGWADARAAFKAAQAAQRAGASTLPKTFPPSSAPSFKPQASPVTQGEVPPVTDKVSIKEVVTNGFIHPGITLTKDLLENARSMAMAGKEPWASGYRSFAMDPASGRNVKARNENAKSPGLPESDAFNSQGMESRFRGDAGKAYRQALMYFFTGDEVYRANALAILRVWSHMDPAKYKTYPDAHIHTGYELKDMTTAAEILRYTSCENPSLAWTEEDTDNFTKNLIKPVIANYMYQNGWFMNQNDFPILGSMSGFIFMNDREGYDQRVEWFTMNSTAPNPGWSGSIQHLARLVDSNAQTGEKLEKPVVQLAEMGRDQAHAGCDTGLFVDISHIMMAQKTKVDPVTGRPSTGPDAVGPFEFLKDRILAATEYFCRFMLGYETPWVPLASSMDKNGKVNAIYPRLSDQYRGDISRLGFWDLYFHYKYRRGLDLAKVAPYFHEAYTKRVTPVPWLTLPKEFGVDGDTLVLKQPPRDAIALERNHSPLSEGVTRVTEGQVPYLHIVPGTEGARFALLQTETKSRNVVLRVRTTGTARMEMRGFQKPWIFPDTHGQWRYVTYSLGELENFDHFYGNIVFCRVQGSPGCSVDFDALYLKPEASMLAPTFSQGGPVRTLTAYVGAPIRMDFSVAAPSTTDSPVYTAEPLPEGATLDPKTGAFSWKPALAGKSNFVVEALCGENAAAQATEITVEKNRDAALRTVSSRLDANRAYTKASCDNFTVALRKATEAVQTSSDEAFLTLLLKAEEAASALEPLTPRLADGSMDFTQCAPCKEMGIKIALLADDNPDTFPIYQLAGPDHAYVFDFGPNYRFAADAFSVLGRLNFEDRVVGTTFFGSDDGQSWIRLTPGTIGMTTTPQRLEVDPAQKGVKYRYLQMKQFPVHGQKCFEPSELRIFGQRYEADGNH